MPSRFSRILVRGRGIGRAVSFQRGAVAQSRRHRARREAIFARDGYRCVYCGRTGTVDELSVDHVEPRTRQGDHSPGNLVTACTACNLAKGGLPAWRYLADRPVERANFLRYATHVWARLRRAIEEAAS